MLSFNHINKIYPVRKDKVRALKDVSFQVEAGEFLVIRGPSGCGKTTLLLIAGGLLSPTSGEVRIDNRDPYRMDASGRNRLRAKTIGFVFQQFYLIPYLTVTENIMAPALTNINGQSTGRAEELVQHFGLTGRENHLPAQLSTGEKQRTALARAIFNRPAIVLADEPTGNLDGENAEIIYRYLKEYSALGNAVLLVSHDKSAVDYGSRVLHMMAGTIV